MANYVHAPGLPPRLLGRSEAPRPEAEDLENAGAPAASKARELSGSLAAQVARHRGLGRSVCCSVALAVALLFVAIGAAAVVAGAPCLHSCPSLASYVSVASFLLTSFAAGVAAIFLLCVSGGGLHVRCAAGFALLNWAFGLVQGLFEASNYKRLPASWSTLLYISFLVYVAVQISLEALLVLRIQALEVSAHKPWCVTARGLWWLLSFQMLPWLLMCGSMIAQWASGGDDQIQAALDGSWMVHHAMFCLIMTMEMCCLAVVLRKMHSAWRVARAAESAERGERALSRAWRAVLRQLLGASSSFALIAVGIITAWLNWAMLKGFLRPDALSHETVWVVLTISQVLDICLNTFSAVVLSGGYRAGQSPASGAPPEGAPARESRAAAAWRRFRKRLLCAASDCKPMMRRGVRLHSMASEKRWLRLESASLPPDSTWTEKVEELAHRGITLGELLCFYKKLGSAYMLHYRPGVHTTNDVVWRAVVPITKAARASYAQVASSGRPPWPRKMVTHNWGNLFRDLVAAVVADALGECSFKMIARLLEEDVSMLERILADSGKLMEAYWICAFSVNQHAGPCDNCPASCVDSLTGEPHPSCDCGLEKFLNRSPPLTLDGRSIHCEMNKFDDMMGYLAEHRRDFEQVVAMDAEFRLFRRAWCVGELAKARDLGLSQRLMLRSKTSLGENEQQLRHLRVEEMQASRKEDVQEILSKISDKSAFNSSLQELLFSRRWGLLAAWRDLDAERQMKEAGRLLRWAGADRGSGVVWRCWED